MVYFLPKVTDDKVLLGAQAGEDDVFVWGDGTNVNDGCVKLSRCEDPCPPSQNNFHMAISNVRARAHTRKWPA